MDLLKKDELNTEIKGNFEYVFEVKEGSLYLIEIVASALSWWPKFGINFWSFFKDDNLAVNLDGRGFPKLSGKKDLFDGEAAWNGNNLEGLSKTIVIISHLKKGEHELNFSANQRPILENVSIYEIKKSEITYIPKKNNPPQDGNRRQWITIVLNYLALEDLEILASADKISFDDEDIKLIIDGKIILNRETRWHKNWYWCGRILRGEEKEFNQKLNLPESLHYIELWADKTPKINNIRIKLRHLDNEKTPNKIIERILTLYREIGQTVEFAKTPVPVENFNKYDEEIKKAGEEFNIEPVILKATIAQESSFGNVIDHDQRYIGESGLMGMERKNSIAQLKELGYSFDYNDIQDVIRASAAYYNWLVAIEVKKFKDSRNPLKLYTQYRKDLKAEKT